MADRDSVKIFSSIMRLLSKQGQWDSKELALKIWQFGKHYDFSPEDMNCNEELLKLGLAIKVNGRGFVGLGEGEHIIYHAYCSGDEFST